MTTIVSIFKSIPLGSPIPLVYNFLGHGFPLGSPIPLVYNIKPLGLLVLLVYNMNNRSMSSMIKCRIVRKKFSMFKSWVHQFLWFIILNPWVY